MRRRGFAWCVAASLLAATCSGSMPPRSLTPAAGPSATSPSTAARAATGSPIPSASPAEAALPEPDEPIPTAPDELAAILTETTDSLGDALEEWTGHGDPSTGQAPDDVVLLAMYQQRMYRLLGRRPRLADRAIPLLPKRLRGTALANAGAAADLFSLVTPISHPSTFHTAQPEPAGRLLSWFKEADGTFGVRWELLAAVMLVESKFGRVRSASTAGAQGPMQFIPSTWAAYGLGGDVHDPHDAILGAANYLHASGAAHHERSALFAYNHAWAYVDAVLAYANQMAADPDAYYAYYSWQVWVLTTSGDQRLTGPGLSAAPPLRLLTP